MYNSLASIMTSRTLGVHGLAPSEAGLVRALLSLAGLNDPRTAWTFVASGPCDVLLVDGKLAAAREAQAHRQARALVMVDAAEGSAGPDAQLSRPLRADALERILARLARHIGGGVPSSKPESRLQAAAVTDQSRYKLLRWPPSELFRSQPRRVRMATHLTRRYLSAGELAMLAGSQEAECALFLRLLQGFQLLAQEKSTAPADPGASAMAAPARPSGWGLVHSIRRRLGL